MRNVLLRFALPNISSAHYVNALLSGYILAGVNLLVQFMMTPLYLKYLGVYQFGVLMMLLNIINFVAIGITWMSGGLVRIMGEFCAKGNKSGFRNVFVVGKYVFTLYAVMVVVLGGGLWWLFEGRHAENLLAVGSMALAGLYLIVNYEALPERQAFVGTNKQDIGNYIELLRIVLFALVAYLLIPVMRDLSAVWIALMTGVLVQRLLMGNYWKREAGASGWGRFNYADMVPLVKRLMGRQGAGYVSYGALLLILQADTVIVGYLGGAEVAGKFVLLWKIPEAIGLLLWRIPSTLEPQVIHLDARGEEERLRSLFIQGRRWFLLLVAVVSLLYMIVGHRLTQLWVGGHAPDQEWMYMVAGLALFFNTLARWPISFAYATLRLAPLTRVAVIEVVAKLVLTVGLFSHLNIASPIIASVIVHMAYVAFAYQKIVKLGGGRA